MIIDSLHILSPLLYALFVSKLKTIKPCPDNYFMKLARYHHNIFLSVLSFFNANRNNNRKLSDK